MGHLLVKIRRHYSAPSEYGPFFIFINKSHISKWKKTEKANLKWTICSTHQLLIRVLLKHTSNLQHRWEYIVMAMQIYSSLPCHKFTLQNCKILHWQLCSCSQCLLSGRMGDGGPSNVQGSPPNLINKHSSLAEADPLPPTESVNTGSFSKRKRDGHLKQTNAYFYQDILMLMAF